MKGNLYPLLKVMPDGFFLPPLILQSPTRSYFSADSAKPVHFAVVSLDSR